MMGQISNHLVPGAQMSDIPVRVKSGRLVLAEARSDQFGEFQMEYEQQNRLHLCVYLEGGARYIQVPLKRFSPGSDTATDRIKPGWNGGKKAYRKLGELSILKKRKPTCFGKLYFAPSY